MFMVELRKQREQLKADGLVHAESGFPTSLTLITAVILLIVGVMAIGSMIFNIGPFG